ncbi:hypothetical protein HY214_02645 [Candidatus Roizmanbacteria bacterium]|nr:hypothetical protein [Candidatus Roizmanbacteria bacterium]
MDILSFFSSISIVSLIAFLVISAVLGYEVYLFKKEREKTSQPAVPQFKETSFTPLAAKVMPSPAGEGGKIIKANNKLLLILIVLFIIFGVVTVLGFMRNEKKKTGPSGRKIPSVSLMPSVSPTPSVTVMPTVSLIPSSQPVTPTTPITATPTVVISRMPTPTDIILALRNTGSPSPSASVSSPTPTAAATTLPQTGVFSNTLIITAVAGAFIVFSFLF